MFFLGGFFDFRDLGCFFVYVLKVLSFCVLSWEKEKRSWFFFVIGTDWCWTWWVFFFLVGSSVIFGLIKKIRVWWLTKDWKGANQWIYRSILLGSCLPFSEYLFFDEQIFTFSFYLVSFASFRWLNLKLWGYPFLLEISQPPCL